MKPKRFLSQNFLTDERYIQKILEHLDISGKNVLEVGAGKGQISIYLTREAKRLYCVEIDERFCNYLKDKFSKNSNVEIIHGDILNFPFSRLRKKAVVFGNIPYRISSLLVEYLIRHRAYILGAYLTFQKEFVQKIMAHHSSGQYGFISCYVQYYAKIDRLFDIPSGAFWPTPKVDSSFIKMEFYRVQPYVAIDENFLFRIIRKAFSCRRKKIINSLSLAKDIFRSVKINPDLRPENLSLKDYVAIANKIYPA
jgi:16S rRNA (adenine1518-N6/adenine1519-N6)-dimethyltransferase